MNYCSRCGKERYNRTAALMAAQAMEMAEGGRFQVYPCGDSWHIGHASAVHKKKRDRGRLIARPF